ncbi:myosin-13-like [Dysidea avara]|uniref:myosin-13-like n=1 Tax=Dysidea avara TaxID=196820 RepID=UPI0033276078
MAEGGNYSEPHSGAAEIVEDVGTMFPTGKTYPLNSKRIVADQIFELATLLDLPSGASVTETRQLIEGRLLELGHEPRNVQVIVQLDDEGKNGSRIFLVDESGVIRESGKSGSRPLSPVSVISSCHESFIDNNVFSCSTHHTLSPVNNGDDALELRSALREARRTNEQLEEKLCQQSTLIDKLVEQLDQVKETNERIQLKLSELQAPNSQVRNLEDALKAESSKSKRLWIQKCEQLLAHESEVVEKELEIARLRSVVEELTCGDKRHEERGPTDERVSGHDHCPSRTSTAQSNTQLHDVNRGRRGKAPPIEYFTGENPEVTLDEWLPSLQRASNWNGWTSEETLIQLAGHLKGQALQEWNLLEDSDKVGWKEAAKVLQSRLEHGNRTMAAQEFRHLRQGTTETVSEFIRRLERTFRIAHGKGMMATESREALLHGQMQEGLLLKLMESPAVSGALDYKSLCLAAKNEEKRLAELSRRYQYQRGDNTYLSSQQKKGIQNERASHRQIYDKKQTQQAGTQKSKGVQQTHDYSPKCYNCGKVGHLAKNCKAPKSESSGQSGRKNSDSNKNSHLWQVGAHEPTTTTSQVEVTDLLESDSSSDSDSVNAIHVGTGPRCVKVTIQGVPMYGVVDTGADITIIGGRLFKLVATKARLKKRNFHKPDTVPRNYDGKVFTLDGKMDLKISFQGKDMTTPVYIKMDAKDQLLLSEVVCRQLGIVQYHPNVEVWRGGHKAQSTDRQSSVVVPMVRVKLVQVTRCLPQQTALARVQVENVLSDQPVLLETSKSFSTETGLELDSAVIVPDEIVPNKKWICTMDLQVSSPMQ